MSATLKALQAVYTRARGARNIFDSPVASSRPITALGICGILLLFLIAAIAAMAAAHFRTRALADNERELQSLAGIIAQHFEEQLQGVELIQGDILEEVRSLGVASGEDYARQMSTREIHAMLKSEIGGLPYISALSLIGPDGALINSSQAWPAPQMRDGERDDFKSADFGAAAETFIGQPIQQGADGAWSVAVGRKIVAANGVFLGLIVGRLELASVERFYRSILREKGGSFALFRDDGVLLVRCPHIPNITGKSFPAVINSIGARESGSIQLVGKMDGEDRLLTARRLPHFPLYVTAGRAVAPALAEWQAQTQFLVVIAMILVLVIGGALYLIVRQLMKQHQRTQEQLALDKVRLDTAVNNMTQGLLLFDEEEKIVLTNKRYIDMYGLSPDVVKAGCSFLELIRHRQELGTFTGNIASYHAGLLRDLAQGKATDMTIETPDGRSVRIVNAPMPGGGWVATHEDISEAKRTEDSLKRTQKFLDTILENVPLPIIVKSVSKSESGEPACRYTLLNRAAEAFLGAPRGQIVGKTAHEWLPQEQADIVDAHDLKALQANTAITIADHPIAILDNTVRLVSARKAVIRDDMGEPQHLISVLDDVTERKRAEQRIAYMAHHDALTSLPNRIAFGEQFAAALDRAANHAETFTLLSIDLDGFKEINDTHGHLIGDAVLREVAARLHRAANGAFLSRIGGDEFMAIVADGAQPGDAMLLGEHLLAALNDEFVFEGQHLRLGASIGGAIYPTDGTDAKTLVANADAALYRAKADARGSVLMFTSEIGLQVRDRRVLQDDFRAAIERHELALDYQPQKKISGETIGFEALARWDCPKRGRVLPGTFITVAEESGLIMRMGEWVLREACREAASWPKPLSVAVNVSPVQFRYVDLPNLVHSILLETGLSPSRLELEITESVLIDDLSRAVSILRRLKSLGVQIALDDFGTGYSSLSYLHSFPFDRIKVDRSFVRDLEHNRHSIAIVRAVIGLGHSLDVPVLAEGVETHAQHAFLRQHGCDAVQGWLTGPPQPICSYQELLGADAKPAELASAQRN